MLWATRTATRSEAAAQQQITGSTDSSAWLGGSHVGLRAAFSSGSRHLPSFGFCCVFLLSWVSAFLSLVPFIPSSSGSGSPLLVTLAPQLGLARAAAGWCAAAAELCCAARLPRPPPSCCTATNHNTVQPANRHLPEARDGAEGAGVAAALRHAQIGGVPRRQAVTVPLRPECHCGVAHLHGGKGSRQRLSVLGA